MTRRRSPTEPPRIDQAEDAQLRAAHELEVARATWTTGNRSLTLHKCDEVVRLTAKACHLAPRELAELSPTAFAGRLELAAPGLEERRWLEVLDRSRITTRHAVDLAGEVMDTPIHRPGGQQ